MKLILAGGFLGSGKTTAIVHACQLLMAEGKRVAVITNDQGDQQVDSAYTKSLGIKTQEVSNGCFCCRYDELDAHIQTLEEEHQPEFVFAESVGSCTDLVATITKPLSQFKPTISTVISVFADASMVAALIEGRATFLEESVRYIYKKQLEEADIIVLNKIDLLADGQLMSIGSIINNEYHGKQIVHQNSLQRQDIIDWIALLNRFASKRSRTSVNVDYNVYGEGEAKLAWLDRSLLIDSPLGNGGFIARQIIRSIFNKIRQQRLTIGHLKFFVETERWSEKISLTTASTSADFKIKEENIPQLKLLINARIQTEPSTLQTIIENVLHATQLSEGCTIATEKYAAFAPGFPTPRHRMA
jgi:G3E family GTPase